MKRGGLVGAVLLLVACSSLFAADDTDARRSVVKVFCTNNALNLGSPWKRGEGRQLSGSGVWLGGKRILTNEHLVVYATQISIQPYESADRIPAEAIAVSPEMDLAVLELDDDTSFANLKPPAFSDQLPRLQSEVRVYGFPEGGDSLSVTEGIVSRIEYSRYGHGAHGLRVQVDAAINPGNSGGPAFADNQIIGIAFRKRSQSDNIGYVIPSEEVQRFLADVEDGHYDGKLCLPIEYQFLLNRSLRGKLGLKAEQTGVWVRSLVETEESFPIHVGDVVTHIGEHDIDNNGNAKLGEDLRVNFEYFISSVAKDDKVPLRVIRDGEEITVDTPVRRPPPRLLRPLKGEYPPYFVYGPLVFIAAPEESVTGVESYLASSDPQQRLSAVAGMTFLTWRRSPLLLRRFEPPKSEGEELVLVSSWLSHRIGIGYSSPTMQVVSQVNGMDIHSLKHLVETLRDLKDDHVEFRFADEHVETLVFDRQPLVDATEEILLNNAIPRQASKELMEVWNQKQESK